MSDAFGKFRLEARVGAGGMGEVWKAWDPELNRWVAIKLLRAGAEHEIDRFAREARTAAALTHPNVASVYEVGAAQGRPYIAMQFVDGRTMKGFPRDERRLIARLVRDAARAVAYAHDCGIVHRDLKPDNLMVTQKGHLFVMDFGLAHPIEGDASASSTGLVGTPDYMAPEQARGEPPDPRSDVWSLGAALYDLLTGRRPFRARTVYETLLAVQEQDPPAPRSLDRRIERDLETIVLTCLDKRLERRYPTAAALAEDLTRWLDGAPVGARSSSRLARFVSRRAGAIAAVLAVAAVAAGVLLWLSASAGRREALEARTRDLEAQAARDRVRTDALAAVERARPAIDEAVRMLYSPDAAYRDLTQRVDEAQRKIEEAMARAPDLVLGHHLVGIAWELKGWDDRAEQSWRAAIAADPSFGPARFRLGRLLLVRSFMAGIGMNASEAPERRKRAQEIAGKAALEIEAALAVGLDDPVSRELAGGLLAYAKNDLDGALRLALAAAERFRGMEGEEEFHWLAGAAGRKPQRMAAWNRTLALKPKHLLALFMRSVDRMQSGDVSGALDDMDAQLAVHPRFLPTYFNRALLHHARGNLDGVIADCTTALEIDPKSAHAFSNRAWAHEAKGDVEAALRDCDEAIRLDPGMTEPRVIRCGLRRARGDLDGSIADAEAVLAVNPRHESALNYRGVARALKGEDDDAIADFDESIRLRPTFPDPYGNRAVLRRKRGDREGALADCRKALEVAPPGWPGRPAVEALLRALRPE